MRFENDIYNIWVKPCDSPDNSPVCVEGRCPIFDILPLQGANVIKPSRGGPRVSFTPFTLPWAEIPLPLQGAAASKPLKYSAFCRVPIKMNANITRVFARL